MKKLLLFLFLLPGLLWAEGVQRRTYSLAPVSGLDIGGAWRIYLSQGDEQKVEVEASNELFENIKLEVKDGVLHVDIEGKKEYYGKKSEVQRLFLTVKNLNKLDIGGAAHLTSENPLGVASLRLDVSGASHVKLDLVAKDIRMDVSGAAKTTLRGSAGRLRGEVSGAANVVAKELAVEMADVEASGAANLSLNPLKELRADASGAASIRYQNPPPQLSVNTSGAGSIKPASGSSERKKSKKYEDE